MKDTIIQSAGHAVQMCGPETGHSVIPVAFCDTPARAATFVQSMRIAEVNASLASTILTVLGNVDYSVGNGPNSALSRGELLNSIRDIARASLEGAD